MKAMGFSISEIKELLKYLRLEVEVVPNLNTILRNFLENKLSMIIEERNSLNLKEKELKETIKLIATQKNSTSDKPAISGIDIQFLPLLCCNKCGHPLQLKKVDIIDGEILNGVLDCKCGMEYLVQDGILLFEGADNEKKAPVFNTKEDIEKLYPGEYVATKLVVEKWLNEKIQQDLKNDDVLLDLSITGGIYSSPLFNDIRKMNILYIGCERWLNYLKISKKAVDVLPFKPKTMFCCGDIKYAPFKPALSDKIIDVYGTMVDMRETGDFKIQHKINLLKDFGQLYSVFHDFSNLSNETDKLIRKSLTFSQAEKELHSLTKKINSMHSPKTKKLGEINTILNTHGREELTVCSYIGKKE